MREFYFVIEMDRLRHLGVPKACSKLASPRVSGEMLAL
jgi:hypothetical protein